jgi:hypothetical protein
MPAQTEQERSRGAWNFWEGDRRGGNNAMRGPAFLPFGFFVKGIVHMYVHIIKERDT